VAISQYYCELKESTCEQWMRSLIASMGNILWPSKCECGSYWVEHEVYAIYHNVSIGDASGLWWTLSVQNICVILQIIKQPYKHQINSIGWSMVEAMYANFLKSTMKAMLKFESFKTIAMK
jgi:hypothetical protein